MKEMKAERRALLKARHEAARIKRLNRLSMLKCQLNFEDAVFTPVTLAQ
jgi:hypothetical protein